MRNIRTKLLAAIIFSAFSLTTIQAAAVTLYESNQTISFADGSSDFGDKFGKALSGFNFLSNFNFAIGSNSDLDSAFVSISGSKSDLSFTGFNLYSSAGMLIKGGDNDLEGKKDMWSMSITDLASGNYRLAVTGKVIGAEGGSFGGNINVSPVPEPTTWGMMVAGLGVIGLAMRRRKSITVPKFSPALVI